MCVNQFIFVANGVYDVVCAVCLIFGVEFSFSKVEEEKSKAIEEESGDKKEDIIPQKSSSVGEEERSSSSKWIALISSFLHTKMFCKAETMSDISIRILGYWVLTYGIMRLVVGILSGEKAFFIGSVTYLLEAACFWFEYSAHGTLVRSKAIFVCLFSLALFMFVNFWSC